MDPGRTLAALALATTSIAAGTASANRTGALGGLNGSVANDFQLRTLYQFINNKGFGEVDYAVEIR